MSIIGKKELAESGPTRPAKVWLLAIPFLGFCLLVMCLAGGGLILFWPKLNKAAVEQPEVVVRNNTPAFQTHDEINLAAPQTPTPVSTPVLLTTPVRAGLSRPTLCGDHRTGDNLAMTKPILSPISFATRHNDDGWPLDAAVQFTTAITTIEASFSYLGLSNGLTWERVWYFGDQEMRRGSGVWDAGSKGQLTVYAEAGEGGFAPGRYRLEIYVAGELLSQGTFVMVAEDTPTQRPVQVAYTTWDGNQHQISLLDLDNRQTQPLIDFARQPVWAANAVDLLFYGEQGLKEGTTGLWIFNPEQKKSTQLSAETFFKDLAWSPDRAFVASSGQKESDTHLILWDLAENQAYNGPPGEEPAWSPEGRRLAFRGCSADSWNISTIQVISNVFDFDSIRPLTKGDDSQPAWSWDGQRIAFARRVEDNQDIYTIAPDGTQLMRLTDHPAIDTTPAWTRDNRLVFRSLRHGQWGIYIMNADGSEQRLLVSTPAESDWQPDRLAVSADVLLVEPPPVSPPPPKFQIPPGQGLLIISNEQNNDEMTFTIDNQEHKIMPFQVNRLPLKPGHYTWTASWPAKASRSGIADIVAGQVAYPVVER